MQFLPTGIKRLAAGERVEAGLLDAMDEFARLACGGDEVVPAARDVRFGVQAQDVGGDGVAVMMIVKQPAVYGGLAESGLDRF